MPAAPTTIDPALRARYEAVVRRVQSAAQRAKRRADDVLLVAVAKSASVRQVVDLVSLGHRDFAENRVQHLIERVAEVDARSPPPACRSRPPAPPADSDRCEAPAGCGRRATRPGRMRRARFAGT
ncbi:MAG: hypothetical protein U0575_16465 [Phycisphaerales bacterium]